MNVESLRNDEFLKDMKELMEKYDIPILQMCYLKPGIAPHGAVVNTLLLPDEGYPPAEYFFKGIKREVDKLIRPHSTGEVTQSASI